MARRSNGGGSMRRIALGRGYNSGEGCRTGILLGFKIELTILAHQTITTGYCLAAVFPSGL